MESKLSVFLLVILALFAGIMLGFVLVYFSGFLQNILIDINECFYVVP